MVRFISERHPELIIRDIGVRFRNGIADVEDAVAAVVRGLPAELGIREQAASAADAAVAPAPGDDAGSDTTSGSAGDRSAARPKPRRSGR